MLRAVSVLGQPLRRLLGRGERVADHELGHAARGLGLGVAMRHDLAAAHDGRGITERFNLVQLVADIEDRDPL